MMWCEHRAYDPESKEILAQMNSNRTENKQTNKNKNKLEKWSCQLYTRGNRVLCPGICYDEIELIG